VGCPLGNLHDPRREQLGLPDVGSLPEDDLACAEIGHDNREA